MTNDIPGVVSLPKLTTDAASEPPTSSPASGSTESLLADTELSPQLAEEYAIQVLERAFQRASAAGDNHDADERAEVHPQGIIGGNSSKLHVSPPVDIQRRQYANLEQRLQHFWAQALPARTVRLHLFAPTLPSSSSSMPLPEKQHSWTSGSKPVCSQDVVTATDGSFQTLFRLSWTDLFQHPGTRKIASGDRSKEYELFVGAQLLATFEPTPTAVCWNTFSIYPCREQVPNQSFLSTPVPSTISIPLSHSRIRVISDINDTVKLTEIHLGAHAMFRNLFMKDLQENVIPLMSEWYNSMWARGVRFHYVVSHFPA